MTKFYKPVGDKALSLKGIEFPVGFVMITMTNTNPGTFTRGTWELINISSDGGILVQYDSDNGYFDLPGQNHGSSYGPGSWNTNDTSLSVNQLPAHTHGSKTLTGSAWNFCGQDSSNGPGNSYNGIISAGGDSSYYYPNSKSNSSAGKDGIYINATHEHDSVGKGNGHHHLHVPPYMIVCMWERVS